MARFRLFIKNVFLLTLTALLMRTIGVWFNLYVTEKLGSDGMGLYSLIMSVFGLAVTVATSAVTLAATRLVSEAMGETEGRESPKVLTAMKVCIRYSLFFGCLAGILLLLLAKPIGGSLLSDLRTVPSLRLLALSLPFLAVTSALSGYFTAVRRVSKNALTQIFEQGLRIGGTILLLTAFSASRSLERDCLCVIAGALLGNFFSFLYCLVLYIVDLRRHHKGERSSEELTAPMQKKLLSIALPVAFSSYLRSGLVTLEHLLIPWGLKKQGASQTKALSTYGLMQGMALPVVMFPYAFLSPFCSMLVPEIAERRAAGDERGVERITERVLRFVLAFGIGTAGLLLCLSTELGLVACGSREAATYIRLLAPLVPIMYLDTAVDSILKGLNEQLWCMRVNIIDSALSVLIVLFLLPRIGIYGYIAEIFACELINASLSIMRLMQIVRLPVGLPKMILSPLLAIFAATALSKLIFAHTLPLALSGWMLSVHIVIIGVLFVVFLKVIDLCWAAVPNLGRLLERKPKQDGKPKCNEEGKAYL